MTPYFIPDEMLIRSLNLAARRGVDVRLILPARSNHISADLARASYVRELHEAGGQVLLLGPRMLHAKAVVIDCQRMYLGSANLTGAGLGAKGEMKRNFEMGIWTESPTLSDSVVDQFNALWDGSRCEGYFSETANAGADRSYRGRCCRIRRQVGLSS